MSSPLITFLTTASRKASRLLARDYFELEQIQSSRRPATDFVNRSHNKTQELLEKELSRYPNSRIISESDEIKPGLDMYFIIEPIDGLQNLSRAIPFFGSVVVACEYKNGSLLPVASVVHFPALGEIVYSSKGGGAWMERHVDQTSQHAARLRISGVSKIENALIVTDAKIDHQWVRSVGCDIYCSYLIAAGKADIFLSNSISKASKLAAEMIIQEAGGSTKILPDYDAKFCASNGLL